MSAAGTTAHALAACIGEGGRMEATAREELTRLFARCGSVADLAAHLGVSTCQVQRLMVGLGVRKAQPWKANKKPTRMQALGCECAKCMGRAAA